MSYPRNAASPPRIAIGPVVQISDGAVQTSGVSIKVKPEGASASAGGGTTSYEEGIVGYVPTQAETDYTAFQVIAYKTGCIPAAVTVVTSANSVAGVPSDSSGVTTLLTRVVGTIASGTHTAQTGDSYAVVTNATYGNAAIRTRGDLAWITATGFSTHSAADVWAVATRTITGGTITSYTGNTPQTGDAYAYLGTNVGLLGANLTAADDAVIAAVGALSIPSAATIADAVWDEATSGHATSGTYGERVLRSATSQATVSVTGSNHVASDVHEIQDDIGDKIADNVLRRNMANVEASSDGDTLALGSVYGFVQMAQESNTTDAPGYLTIKKTDGSTTLGTKTLASDPDAEPITGVS